jgi:RES domain-containing protein
LASGREALLVVPSVLIAEESIVLINTAHDDARRLIASEVRRFWFDQRV